MNGLVGLIPAAGRGTRMGSPFEGLPKPLVEIEGRPLLAHALETLVGLGVAEIVVVTGHEARLVERALAAMACAVPVRTVRQSPLLGLAHAIAVARPLISGPLVVHCPDSLYRDLSDLRQARDRFLARSPRALQCVTVAPTGRSHRSAYDAFDGVLLETNLFSVGAGGRPGPLPLWSSGVIFLSPEALCGLPDFEGLSDEQPFTRYVSSLRDAGPFLAHLLGSGRDDFTSSEDVDAYRRHGESWGAAGGGTGVSIVLVGGDGRFLLHKRDDKPGIRYPGHWALFGGSAEPGETPAEAIRREVREEIGYDLDCFGALRRFVHEGKREWAFVGRVTAGLERLTLQEGAGMAFFRPQEIPDLRIRPDDRETLLGYLGSGPDG
ncbi:MAG: NTP transferase domain-containing protein [Magnetospirillum sp. WYHS-4]